MGAGIGGQWHPYIFIRNTDKEEGALMVLFFGLVFFFGAPSLLKIFLPTPLLLSYSVLRKRGLNGNAKQK